MSPRQSLADLTTLRIGGPIGALVEAPTEEGLIEAIREADASEASLLVLGGGSNIVVSDEGFSGVVVRDLRVSVSVKDSPGGGVNVTVAAGMPWDELVIRAVREGWAGLEALSGIPGSTGATPVQNVGAYGHEVSEVIAAVKVWDRAEDRVRILPRDECGFTYRDSLLKRSMRGESGDGKRWRPTPRFVVLDVTFRLESGALSAPVLYGQLAKSLGVEVGERAQLARVREGVLLLRCSKGMVLDPSDHDTWSVGSFFTNPVLSVDQARLLPEDAPRFPLTGAETLRAVKAGAVKIGAVRTSAAWLIEHAGFGRGFALVEGSPVSLSTKHTLAITNRGEASAVDILDLARHIRDGVRKAYGVTLEPEPILIGLSL